LPPYPANLMARGQSQRAPLAVDAQLEACVRIALELSRGLREGVLEGLDGFGGGGTQSVHGGAGLLGADAHEGENAVDSGLDRCVGWRRASCRVELHGRTDESLEQ